MNQAILDIRDQLGKPLGATAEGQDCCSKNSTTSTQAFLDRLRGAKPDQQLVFQLDQTVLVETGYHVTEVKAVTYSTMDCGGVADDWKETVIQLWNPGDEPEREYMTVKKFLAIYDRVVEHIPVSTNAELRFEYGDTYRPAIMYHVERTPSVSTTQVILTLPIFQRLISPVITPPVVCSNVQSAAGLDSR